MYKLVHARFRPSAEVIEHSRRSLALLESDPASAVDALEARFSLAFALVSCTPADCEEALLLFDSCIETAQQLGDKARGGDAAAGHRP